MGKGNFILGTGSSSIGDVTFARRNGQQIARVRVRKIKNPKSVGQATQRMLSSMVVKFYSPLSKVLETSFEGLSKADSYAKFLSVNMNLAKANSWCSPKGTYKAYPFQLSEGSLPQPIIDSGYLQIGNLETLPSTLGALSTAIIATYPQLQNGDQVTAIAWEKTDNDFNHWQITVNRFFLDTASAAAIPAFLQVSARGVAPYASDEYNSFIFSRWDGAKWARSTSFVFANPDTMETWMTEAKFEEAVASFMKSGGSTPVSDVYLNGSDD